MIKNSINDPFLRMQRLAGIVNEGISHVEEKFSKKHDNNPSLKGGQKNLPDELQGAIIKKSMTEEVDYEGEMAKSELRNIIKNAEEIHSMLEDDTQLEAWVQSKLSRSSDYLSSINQYLQSNHYQDKHLGKEEY